MKTYASMKEVKAAHPQWFSPETMRWWNSHVCGGLIGGSYFVTSEQMGGEPVAYTVRQATETGIETVGQMGAYAELSEALAAARQARWP